jgi:hypothetical protein
MHEIPLVDVFTALKSITAAVHRLAGLNLWRETDPNNPRMSAIDSQLACEIVAPPSKGFGNQDSVWRFVHFKLVIPAIIQLRKCINHPLLTDMRIPEAHMNNYFCAWEDLKKQLQSLQRAHELVQELVHLIDTHEHDLEQMKISVERSTCSQQTRKLLSAYLDYLSHHTDSNGIMQRIDTTIRTLTTYANTMCPDYSPLFRVILESLPTEYSSLPIYLQEFIQRSTKENDIVGRVFQSFYGDRRACSYEQVGIPCQAKDYFVGNNMDLFERVLNYCFKQLPNCPIRFDNLESFCMSDILKLYSDWFQRPLVVEMVASGFKGAATEASILICQIINEIVIKTRGTINLSTVVVSSTCVRVGMCPFSTAEKLTRTDRIRNLAIDGRGVLDNLAMAKNMGRLAMFMDIVANGKGHGKDTFMDNAEHMFGESVITVARALFSPEQLCSVWGSSSQYMLNPSQIEQFIADVASVLYATSLNISDHSQEHIFEHEKMTVNELQELAWKCKSCISVKELKKTMEGEQVATLIRNAIECVSSIIERDESSAKSILLLVYVARYFEILRWEPVPIVPREILKGLPVLEYDSNEKCLHVQYVEANQVIKFTVPLENGVQEHVSAEYVQNRITQAQLVYPDYYKLTIQGNELCIPKIGRECYDVMGYDSSRYAGLVVGYGCSVFHSSLQFVQLLSALLGASYAALIQIQKEFFQIDTALHNRHDLASFQTEQIYQAVYNHKLITYADYINTEQVYNRIHKDSRFQHTRDYLSEECTIDTFKRESFDLQQNNTALYPLKFEDKLKISPRSSFFDGSNVEIYMDVECGTDRDPIEHLIKCL